MKKSLFFLVLLSAFLGIILSGITLPVWALEIKLATPAMSGAPPVSLPAAPKTTNPAAAPPQAEGTLQNAQPPQPEIPEFHSEAMRTERVVQPVSVEQREAQAREEATPPAETERQPTALELLDAPMPSPKPVQIIHEGQITLDGGALPPIVEERIPASPGPVEQPSTPQIIYSQAPTTPPEPTPAAPQK